MVLVGTLGDTLVKELAGTVKFPNRGALVPYYWETRSVTSGITGDN